MRNDVQTGFCLSRAHLKRIIDHAERAYPDECCGLLSGISVDGGSTIVSGVHPSRNLRRDRLRDRFEIDPKLDIGLRRCFRGSRYSVVGVYHSHPNAAAQPSDIDLANASDTELAWLIVAVEGGQAIQTACFMPNADGQSFMEVALRTGDWRTPDHKSGQIV